MHENQDDAMSLSEWEEDQCELLDKTKVKRILSYRESARADHLSEDPNKEEREPCRRGGRQGTCG